MAHATRGFRSSAYEILQVVNVDHSALSLTIRHAASYEPQEFRLRTRDTVAAHQLLDAMAASIKVSPTADRHSGWESRETVQYSIWYARVILAELHAHGVEDFGDSRVDIPLLRSLYEPLQEGTRRNAVHLLARVMRAEHPTGTALARALKNTRFPAEEGETFTYDDDIAEAIEAAAKGVWADHYAACRQLFERMGYDVQAGRGRGWLHVPAAEVIAGYERTQPTWCAPTAPQPLDGVFDHEVAWALTHPHAFGIFNGTAPRLIRPTLRDIGSLLYPDRQTLTAALILHCLGENSGYNYSVLMEKSADSLTYIGQDTALETNVKARNHSEDTRPTSTASIYTPGGIIEVLNGITRFSRHSRRDLRDDADQHPPIVDRLYIAHAADPTKSKIMPNGYLHNGWRTEAFAKHWPLASDHSDVSLRFRALRLVSQARAMKEGLKADVHGHTERTKVHYLAHVLPAHTFHQHATEAQDHFHDESVANFQHPTPTDQNPAAAALATAAQTGQVVDVEIGLCASGGNDPDEPTKPCSLGINACFTCPNGFRTVDHVPGLLAAVELTHIIEDNDADEWQTGEAPQLRFFAQAALDQFSPLVVNNVRRNVDLTPHLHTVTGIYLELKHG